MEEAHSNKIETKEDLLSIKIEEISLSGLLRIKFSDPLVPIKDLSRLKKIGQGNSKPPIEIQVDMVENQEPEMVGFSWRAQSFTRTELLI